MGETCKPPDHIDKSNEKLIYHLIDHTCSSKDCDHG